METSALPALKSSKRGSVCDSTVGEDVRASPGQSVCSCVSMVGDDVARAAMARSGELDAEVAAAEDIIVAIVSARSTTSASPNDSSISVPRLTDSVRTSTTESSLEYMSSGLCSVSLSQLCARSARSDRMKLPSGLLLRLALALAVPIRRSASATARVASSSTSCALTSFSPAASEGLPLPPASIACRSCKHNPGGVSTLLAESLRR